MKLVDLLIILARESGSRLYRERKGSARSALTDSKR